MRSRADERHHVRAVQIADAGLHRAGLARHARSTLPAGIGAVAVVDGRRAVALGIRVGPRGNGPARAGDAAGLRGRAGLTGAAARGVAADPVLGRAVAEDALRAHAADLAVLLLAVPHPVAGIVAHAGVRGIVVRSVHR